MTDLKTGCSAFKGIVLDQKTTVNDANVMFHAMSRWPKCRVYWMTEHSIDTPVMWLDDDGDARHCEIAPHSGAMIASIAALLMN